MSNAGSHIATGGAGGRTRRHPGSKPALSLLLVIVWLVPDKGSLWNYPYRPQKGLRTHYIGEIRYVDVGFVDLA